LPSMAVPLLRTVQQRASRRAILNRKSSHLWES
jgi:hypothetical protein